MRKIWIIGVFLLISHGVTYAQFLTKTSIPVKIQDLTEKPKKNARYTLGAGFYTQFIDPKLLSFGVDSAHIFSDIRNPYHHAILKIGMGIGLIPGQSDKTLIAPEITASLGYLWIVDKVYTLDRLGIGVTTDTGIIISDLANQYSVGISVQLIFNNVLVSIGTGANIQTMQTYGRISLGILM